MTLFKFSKLKVTQQLALSFSGLILLGSFLLSLPFSQKDIPISYLDHLLNAVSAVCVTGLMSGSLLEYYSLFGQLVILVLMQIGGLGLMTFIAYLVVFSQDNFP